MISLKKILIELGTITEFTGYASTRGQGYNYKGEKIKNQIIDLGSSDNQSMLEPKILDISDEDSSYDPIEAGDYDELNYSSPIFLNPNI
jgi:hypothetical protein